MAVSVRGGGGVEHGSVSVGGGGVEHVQCQCMVGGG